MMDNRSWAGLIRDAMEARLESVFTALPGEVIRYDADKQAADVQPMIKRVVRRSDGSAQAEDLPILPNVPVVFPAAGGFRLTLPVAKGDPVLLVFTQRPIDEWRRTGELSHPGDLRLHHPSGVVALPGLMPNAEAGAHGENLVLGAKGGAEIHITKDEVKLGGEGASRGVAREGDEVEVTFGPGTFLEAAQGGVYNVAPVKVKGTITQASAKVKSE